MRNRAPQRTTVMGIVMSWAISGAIAWAVCGMALASSARGDDERDAIAKLNAAGATAGGEAASGFKVSIGPTAAPEAYAQLAKVPHLRWLILEGNWVTDAHLKELPRFNRALEILDLKAPNVGDAGVRSIAELTEVFLLLLHNLKVTDEGLAPLARLKKLANLELSECKGVHGAGLKHLRALPRFSTLQFRRSGLRDAELAHLHDLRHLRLLTIQEEQITDAAVPHLKGFAAPQNFAELMLYDTAITAEGVAALRQSRPGLFIVRADVSAGQKKLREIGVALHKYRARQGHFPPAALTGPDGETRHSWRVAILPELGQKALYEQYRRDQPWDSAANQKVLRQMPDVYRAPGAPADIDNAAYFAITGPTTLFPGPEGFPSGGIGDRIRGTIMVVEDKRNVPWTKPDDIPYDDDRPVPNLGSLHEHGFNALTAGGEPMFVVFYDPPKSEAWDESLRVSLSTSGDQIWKRKLVKKLVGTRAPDFSLKDLSGEEVSFSKLTKGKVALISFCAVACGPCRVEAPHLARLYTKHKNDGLVVVTVNAWNEPAEMVRKYVAQEKLSNVFLLNGRTVAQEKFLVRVYPTRCWIDRQGVIAAVDFGLLSGGDQALESKADNLLAGQRSDAR
jgi:thiol-disulfide isomerase/thioredoxin